MAVAIGEGVAVKMDVKIGSGGGLVSPDGSPQATASRKRVNKRAQIRDATGAFSASVIGGLHFSPSHCFLPTKLP